MQNYNDWLANENQFSKGKKLFLVTSQLQLQLKAYGKLASLTAATLDVLMWIY